MKNALHVAAGKGKAEEVRKLAKGGLFAKEISVFSTDESGWTPLHYAAFGDHDEVVLALNSLGANLEAKDDSGYTPLHYAAKYGHDKAIRALHGSGANVETTSDYDGYTPMHFAAVKGHKSTILILHNLGANLEAKNRFGYTPLHYAAASGYEEIILVLHGLGAIVKAKDKEGWTPLHWVAKFGHESCALILLKIGAKDDVKDNNCRTPLDVAEEYGHADLVARWNDIKAQAINELKELASKKNAMHEAAEKGDVDEIRKLAKRGSSSVHDIDEHGRTPLHLASLNGYEKAISALHSLGAFLDKKNKNGWTPLHLAAANGRDKAILTLHGLGANLEARENDGYTPLHLAASLGKESCVLVLFKIGAKDDVKNNEGHTPLDLAEENDEIDLVAKWNKIKQQASPSRFTDAKIEIEEKDKAMVERRTIIESGIFKFLIETVDLPENESYRYAEAMYEDGFINIEFVSKVKCFDISPYNFKRAHAIIFQEKLDEYKVENTRNTSSLPSSSKESEESKKEREENEKKVQELLKIEEREKKERESNEFLKAKEKEGKSVTLKSSGTYTLGKLIHHGNHSLYEAVRKGKITEECVIKVYKSNDLSSFKHEVKFHEKMNEPEIKLESKKYVVEAKDWEENVVLLSDTIHILVLEKGETDFLRWLLKKPNDLHKRLRLSELIEAASFIHDLGFIHCDLKPTNVALFKKDSDTVLKLIDFDSYRKVGEEIGNSHSAEYTAPEIWQSRKSNKSLTATFAMDIWSIGVIILRMFQPKCTHELMLSTSTEDFERNADLVKSLLDLKFKDVLLSNVKDSTLFDILDKHFLVHVQNSLNSSEEFKRDTNLTQTRNHTYFNYASTSSLGSKIDSVRKEVIIVKGDIEIVKEETKEINRKLEDLIKSVDNLSILVKHCNGLLDFPMNFIVVPSNNNNQETKKKVVKETTNKHKDKHKREIFKFKSWLTWEGLKANAAKTDDAFIKTRDKVLKDTGMQVEVNFVFICEGCIKNPKIPCNRTSAGFRVTLPGETLRKIGPALVFGAKVLNLCLKIGNLASGLPLPSNIPGVDQFETFIESYVDFVDFPLTPAELELYMISSGNYDVDKSNPPKQSALISSISDNMESCGGYVEKNLDFKLIDHVKTSYTEAKKWVNKFEDPKWNEDEYDLKRYKEGKDILWLCDNHGEKSGLERYNYEYK